MRRRVGTAFKLDDLFPYDEVVTAVYFYSLKNRFFVVFTALHIKVCSIVILKNGHKFLKKVAFFGVWEDMVLFNKKKLPIGSISEESGEQVCLAAKNCGSSHQTIQRR